MNQAAADAVVERFRSRPFEWAAADCKSFACAFVDAWAGTDFGARLEQDLPRYLTAIEAIRIIHGAGGWVKIISKYLGDPVDPRSAEFGDVVLGRGAPPFEASQLLGICDEELFMAPGALGLTWLPMSNALQVWKCPRH